MTRGKRIETLTANTGSETVTGSDTASENITGSDTAGETVTGSDTASENITGSDTAGETVTGSDTGSDTASDTGSDTGSDTASDTASEFDALAAWESHRITLQQRKVTLKGNDRARNRLVALFKGRDQQSRADSFLSSVDYVPWDSRVGFASEWVLPDKVNPRPDGKAWDGASLLLHIFPHSDSDLQSAKVTAKQWDQDAARVIKALALAQQEHDHLFKSVNDTLAQYHCVATWDSASKCLKVTEKGQTWPFERATTGTATTGTATTGTATTGTVTTSESVVTYELYQGDELKARSVKASECAQAVGLETKHISAFHPISQWLAQDKARSFKVLNVNGPTSGNMSKYLKTAAKNGQVVYVPAIPGADSDNADSDNADSEDASN